MAIRQSSALPHIQDTKRCSVCGDEKSLSEFARDSRKRLGIRCSCKSCNKDWLALHPGYMEEWRKSNSGYMEEWRKLNPGYSTIQARKWRKSNPEKNTAIRNNRRSRKLNADGTHTATDIQQLFVLQKRKCAICRTSIISRYHVDHIIPLALNGGNGKDNLQLLCPSCNMSKHSKHPVDFMQSRGMLL